MQGARQSLEGVDGNHALPPFNLAHVREAQLRLEGEFLLRQFPRLPLQPDRFAQLTLKFGCTVWHVG